MYKCMDCPYRIQGLAAGNFMNRILTFFYFPCCEMTLLFLVKRYLNFTDDLTEIEFSWKESERAFKLYKEKQVCSGKSISFMPYLIIYPSIDLVFFS